MSKLFYAVNLFIDKCTLLRLAKLFESITWTIFHVPLTITKELPSSSFNLILDVAVVIMWVEFMLIL